MRVDQKNSKVLVRWFCVAKYSNHNVVIVNDYGHSRL